MKEKEQSLNSGHRKRLRDKFLSSGNSALHDYEIIELLLTYAIPRRDVKNLAKILLNKFGNFNNFMNASLEDLTQVSGIGENTATLILTLKSLTFKYLQEHTYNSFPLSEPNSIARFANMKIGGIPQETYMIIFLDGQNHVVNYEFHSPQSLKNLLIARKNFAATCLQNKTVAIAIANNKISAICEPSSDDIKIAQAIMATVKTLDIKFFDYIILTKNESYSLREHNLIGNS